MSTNVLERYEIEFPMSCHIAIDNGRREVNGEITEGYSVQVTAPGLFKEGRFGTMTEALEFALRCVQFPRRHDEQA